MRIAIDASRTTTARVTGTEHYALALIRALIAHNTRHDITLYFRDAPAPGLFPAHPLVTHRVIPFSRLWTHLRFAAALWSDQPDVTFVPAHTLPFAFPGAAVVTVHDLGYRHFPEAHPGFSRHYLDWTTRYSAHRARHVLADSQATADDLHHFYGVQPEKVHTVYPGIDAPPIAPDRAAVRAKYDLPLRYFLFMGTLQPRKNISRIVQAYTQWRSEHPDDSAQFVLAGGKGWLFDPAWESVDGVRCIGYVDEADKGAIYAEALALVFPSLYEGFGFPALEAMACGLPVIASDTSSLPELVTGAGLLVDPLNVDAISAAMSRLSTDAALREQLIGQGYERVRAFTWERAAAQTLTVLEQAGASHA